MAIQNYNPWAFQGGYAQDGSQLHSGWHPELISAISHARQLAGLGDVGYDLDQYAQGVNADTSLQVQNPYAIADQILKNMGLGGTPVRSGAELQALNNQIRHTGIKNPFEEATELPKDILSNPGVAQFLTVAGLGAGLGAYNGGGGSFSGLAPSTGAAPAATGLSGNAAIMGMGTPMTPAEIAAITPAQQAGLSQFAAARGLTGAAATQLASAPSAAVGASTPATPGVGVAAAPAAASTAGLASGLPGILSSPTALGMGAGALLGGLGGSEQAGTVTTEEGLPDWLMPYAKPALDKYSTDLQNYQIDPYGVMPSAMKEFQNTVSGMYLDPSTNKYLEDYFRLGSERIKGSLSPSFGHMNAFGAHSGYNEALSRGLGDFATGLYGGNYAKERDRQTQMTAAAPSFIGQSSQAAFAPYQQYLSTVGGLGKKKDQPFFENQFGNILGGAMVGGSLGNIWK